MVVRMVRAAVRVGEAVTRYLDIGRRGEGDHVARDK